MTEEERFQIKKDMIRGRLFKYSKKAFRMIPKLDRPRILDIGCGSGVSTIELAKLSGGKVIAIDIDQAVLDRFTRKIEEAGLTDSVQAINCSLLDMAFPDESFDIILAEGSIAVIGFRRGLWEWKRFLKPNGFMMIHDEEGNVAEKLEQISECGYELLGYFILDIETWQAEYFAPLKKLADETERKYADNPCVQGELLKARQEIDMFTNDPGNNSSVCFVMKKR